MVYDRWTLHIDKVTSDFLREFDSLTSFELNWKPRADRWSIAQNIDHLMAISGTYIPLVDSMRVGQYKPHFIAKFSFFVHRCGEYVLDAVYTDLIRKMRTFPTWQTLHEVDHKILSKFEQHQNSLKQLVSDSYELLDKQAVISSPANRLVVYKLSTAFDIIVAHEKNHFEYAMKVLRLLQHKKATSR